MGSKIASDVLREGISGGCWAAPGRLGPFQGHSMIMDVACVHSAPQQQP